MFFTLFIFLYLFCLFSVYIFIFALFVLCLNLYCVSHTVTTYHSRISSYFLGYRVIFYIPFLRLMNLAFKDLL